MNAAIEPSWTRATVAEIRDDIAAFVKLAGGEIYPWQREVIDTLGGRKIILPHGTYVALRSYRGGGGGGGIPTARALAALAPPKPSHKRTPLDRAEQGRAARAAMLRRVAK